MIEKTISGLHVSPGIAETLVRRGGITNHFLIASLLRTSVPKITEIGWSASNLQCATSVSCFETQCIHLCCKYSQMLTSAWHNGYTCAWPI